MNLTAKKILLVILALVLVVEIGFIFVLIGGSKDTSAETVAATEPAATEAIAPAETVPPTETVAPTEAPTEPPVTEPPVTEPPVTEPKEKHYTLSFAGDCTFGSIKSNWNNPNHFIQTIGEDYDYPFANVRQYFENDDFTIINLEGPLTDESSGAQSKKFAFRGPTAYSAIMTGSSVEAVTLANNHAEDYGKAGYDSTTKALSEAGISFVEENKTTLFTTESGLVIGLYADTFTFSTADIQKNVKKLRDSGAEIVICAFHWGTEGSYRPTAQQKQRIHIAAEGQRAQIDTCKAHPPH